MKYFKKIALLLLSAMILAVLPTSSTLKASAAEPTTHLIIFDSDEARWMCRVGGSNWDDSKPAEHWETYYLEKDTFKDGDTLIIDGEAPYEHRLELDLSHRRIGNLTITNRSEGIVVSAGSIDKCYALGDSSSSISGTITTANVYDNAAVTFLGNIANLNIIGTRTDEEINAAVGCHGTVGHLHMEDFKGVLDRYDIQKGTLEVEGGNLTTDSSDYKTTPSAAVQKTASTQQTAQKTAATSNANDAYDKVPKTGDNRVSLPLLLIGIAAVCFAGKTVLKKA